MEPLQPMGPLTELKEQDPITYDLVQDAIRAIIRRSDTIVRQMTQYGIVGESLHEAVEGLLEKGLLRLCFQEGPMPDQLRVYLQVYDPVFLEYRYIVDRSRSEDRA